MTGKAEKGVIELEDEQKIVDEFASGMNALAGRYSDCGDTSLATSAPRKTGRAISASETKKLARFALRIYDDIGEHYWWGYYGNPQSPYIEEKLEVMPDGSVRYSATFLPVRFTPDASQNEEAA